jgi:excisionase family DNA binding protein
VRKESAKAAKVTIPDGDILTSTEAAALLRVSRQTLFDLCQHGLPHRRVGLKKSDYRFSRAAIEEWSRGQDGAA